MLALVLLVLFIYLFCLPRPLFSDPSSTVLFDSDGIMLGAKIAEDGQWRFSEVNQVPEKLKTCILAYEDQYFMIHPGFNPVSLFRAFFQNIKAGKTVSGGSTITMQVVRLSRKGKPRTITEKFIEIILATHIEMTMSKEQILCIYCSHAPYGGNIVGLEAASWRYFGIGSHELSWAEAALIAVLPNAPSLIHPGKNPFLLLSKRNQLLEKLYRFEKIDSFTCAVSKLEPIPQSPLPLPQTSTHLLSRVIKEYPGKSIRSTLNRSLQIKSNDIISKYYEIFKHNGINNLAALIVEVESGNVLAYVGNVNNNGGPDNGQDVDIIMSARSTGSLLKPFLFGAMLEDGLILPWSLIPDIPTTYKGFTPENFNQQYDGAVQARNALSRSLNVPAVRMLNQYGVEKFCQLLKQLGMSTLNKPSEHYGLSVILGGAEGKLWEMLSIYAGLSRVLNHYNQYNKYFGADFMDLNYNAEKSPVNLMSVSFDQPLNFSASTIWYVYNAMHEVNRPDEESGWMRFSSGKRIAWKTGTSFGNRDGWAIGTTTEYAIGVWVGNADGEGRPGLTGIACAAPVMFELFYLLPYKGWFKEPVNELVEAQVCRQSGYKSGKNCSDRDTMKIPKTCLSAPQCPFHKLIHLSADEKFRVNSNCEDISTMIHKAWFVLPPIQEWYYKNKHPEYAVLPPFKEDCATQDIRCMELIYPRDEIRIFIPVQLDGTKGRVVFEAAHRNKEKQIHWHLDNHYISSTRYIHQVELLPAKGWHTITLVDEDGEILVKKFYVIDD
jgi:penicillin-binding protein 1C